MSLSSKTNLSKGNAAATGSFVVENEGYHKHQIVTEVDTPGAGGVMTVKFTPPGGASVNDLPTPVTMDLTADADLNVIECIGKLTLAWTGFNGTSFGVFVESYDT